jgi:hypothetical protein
MFYLIVYLVVLFAFIVVGGYKQEPSEDVLFFAMIWPVWLVVWVLYLPYLIGEKLYKHRIRKAVKS